MTSVRVDGLDALRGLAMLWMTGYHLCFDLAHFRVIDANFYLDSVWTWQRSAILSLFLLCAGMGQAIAVAQGQTWARFWRRWLQVAACAVLVTLGSMYMFPKSYIYFGVLHALCVMLILARLAAPLGRKLWMLGVLLFASFVIATEGASYLGRAEFLPNHLLLGLNSPPWNVFGLVTQKPITEDYVPLLPWLALVLWGVALGQHLSTKVPRWLDMMSHIRPLSTLGRWSLSYYMVHQPLIILTLMLMGIASLKP